ncbi:transglutaminase family protein [Methylocaldum sp.]|uniref:transglutaminase family protein n=1 Tax=Methylocaldum sp. TaxID=1969727 RepID=UPI002D6401E1|nr:transglutaminase family protein [Methylocaldum sp.]HYE37217.1 transglutaminase family protein [Methylocaldum sp.]
MAILVEIEHITTYRYDRPVQLSPHLIRLRPAPHTRTPVHDYRLDIGPSEHRIYWQHDSFGNRIARVVFPEKVNELKVDVRVVAEMTVINPFDFFVENYAEHYPFEYDSLLKHELEPYFEITENGPRLSAWLGGANRNKQRIVDFLVELNQQLQKDIAYTIRLDPGIQSCEETFEKGTGSCRDTGWLLVQILRRLGLAARFVSGYLIQLTADQKALDGPSGPEHDFTDLHAWAEVYIPGAGWIGLDPTSGLFAGEGHIPLACTPDAVSAAPVTGYADKCEVHFEYSNVVRRIHEDPRVTKPYTEDQWTDIQQLGRAVDSELSALDVRLTMGGEPTFVSIDDMEGAEWNTEALGIHKRERAGALLEQLKNAFAPGGLLYYGQGKWYPGEPLPRWALGCFWRADGVPLWRNGSWVADERRDYGFTETDARHFGERLATRLGIEAAYLTPGFEDWIYYLWREANQPADFNPIAIPWAPRYRDDLSLALARGLDRTVGYALPLAWDWSRGAWHSGPWNFRRNAMYLIPGSSPMGFRLPIRELGWTAEIESEESFAEPPEPAKPIPVTFNGMPEPPEHRRPLAADERPEIIRRRYKKWVGVPHTALCLEPRAGRLYVFMPPVNELQHYGDLLAAIEQTAAELNLPVIVEGYEPPASPELRCLKVTPDPGVIEINIHPAASWDALEENTVTLYEEARLARLATEKFMLDGRHTGTGGGNHVTLGGATVHDSPFLRRPDLLRSLITYWQHHPSLSYLFSGLFIGPTSQAPRVDERGGHLLDELELSLNEIERTQDSRMVDRALRSFLADLTGNTHRSEFCIDKLYSMDTASGRQGLVEFRGFEMPPHARMSLAQMLLLRTLIAYFWKHPYRHPLVRWGTALHDRFLLPHYVWADFRSVIAELNEAGYPFSTAWYEPFLEFRFPHYGQVECEGVVLELRMALEPWLVLGEEAGAQREARVVDSAVERLQVKCRGYDPERFLVTCNGRRIPLQPTGPEGEYVAGVRYKAWKAAFGLHPTIEVHAPLVFDLFDRRLGRSVGGCVYHIAHPGGRSYETFPVNAYEAESRRISRFWDWGHTAGDRPPPVWAEKLKAHYGHGSATQVHEPPPEPMNPDYPCTLDLRRPL